MRLVIDTNIFVSALLSSTSSPGHLMLLWDEGDFDLLTSVEQIHELMRVTRYPKLRNRLAPVVTGRLINQIRNAGILLAGLPSIDVSPDPHDNYLLAMAALGGADFLVTGDKRDLLALKLFRGTRIVTARDFLILQGKLP